MAKLVTIGGDGALFVGEDKTLRLELLDKNLVPVDMAGWVMVFDVRATDKSADPALLSLTPTITGIYSATKAANTQRAEVPLSDDNMNLFKEKTYRYSWKRLTAGNETVVAWGDFAPQKATAP